MTTMNTVTVNPSTSLNLERMTPEYFYWNVFKDDISQVKIPTTAELEFLGETNLQELKQFFRHKEKRLSKLYKRALKELKSITEANPEIIRNMVANERKCDWRGAGYATINQNLLLPENIDKLSSTEAQKYRNTAEQRCKMVCSCRFGHEIAGWCQNNPQPCQDQRACMSQDGKITCPHYTVCSGVMPLQQTDCIFTNADQKMLDDCKAYLQSRVDYYHLRLGLLKKYMCNITSALKTSSGVKKPSFSRSAIFEIAPRERIVQIRKDGGVTGGAFIGYFFDNDGKEFMFFDMDNGTVAKIKILSFFGNRIYSDFVPGSGPLKFLLNCYMPEDDFRYLLNNPDFYMVWRRMSSCPFVESAIDKAKAAMF